MGLTVTPGFGMFAANAAPAGTGSPTGATDDLAQALDFVVS